MSDKEKDSVLIEIVPVNRGSVDIHAGNITAMIRVTSDGVYCNLFDQHVLDYAEDNDALMSGCSALFSDTERGSR